MVSEPGSGVTPSKLLPQNFEAEEAVLGALLIDPDAIIRVATFLQAGDFYVQRHGMIYQAVLDLHERREPADLVTLTDELERRGQLAEVGGPAFLTGLINATPTSIHVEYYARIVERTAVLRRLIDAAGQIAKLAYQDVDDVDEVVDRAESIIFGVSEKRVSRELVPIRQVLDDFYDRIEYLREHQGEIIGIPTGLADLDKLLGGFQRSDLVIIAGRPGMGKTSLALSIALQAARRWNKRVGIFSMEMSNEQVVQRLVSAETGIDSQRLRLGAIHDDEWPTFFQATSLLSTTQIFIDDTPAISALEMRTKARRLHAEHGLDMIIVDYLQLMRGDLRSENRVQEISFISRSLKALARELNIPVVALSQLSRAVEARADRRPMLSDLRESGCLTGDTLVYMPNQGSYIPIGDLAGKSGFEVMGLDPQTLKLVPAVASRAFCTGAKPVYRLTTRLGRSVRATANHKFLTVRGWKRLDELAPNERIALPRSLIGPASQSMSDAELALLGHLIGDGCTLPRHAVQYTTREKDYASSSERLAPDVQSLLLRLGINARLARYSQNGKGRDQYHVTVSGKPDLESFISVIGTVGQYKGGHLAAIRQYVSARQANTNRDAIPRDVWQMYAVPAMRREGITTRRLHADLGNAYCGTALYKQNISRDRAARLARVVRSDEIACLAESNVYWDEVISIEAGEIEEVFDLTVPGLHNFVASDIIVHNSIEQDADVVMFVYRDDMYDPDTEFPNIAELRVAKHRSGPTGIFSVYFKKELAQFVDLEVRRESLDY